MPNPYAAQNLRTLLACLLLLAVASQFVEGGVLIMLGVAVLWWLSASGLQKPTSHSAVDASGNIIHHGEGDAMARLRARQRGVDPSLPSVTAAQARASSQEKLR
jgi:hypothetical protein